MSAASFLFNSAKFFFKVFLFLLLLLLIGWLALWYMARPANAICDQISVRDNRTTVIEDAKARQFTVIDLHKDKAIKLNNVVKIYPKQSPYLSFVCVVSFDKDKVVTKQVIIEN